MISVNDRLVSEAISHAVDLDQYGTGVVRRMLALLNRVDADLFARLTAALGNLDAESFTVERLESLLMSVRTMHAQAYLQLERALTSELREFVATEWGYQQQLLPSVGVPLSFGTGVATAEQVYAAAMSRPFQGRLLSEWASGIEAQRMTRIRDAVRIGYVENESVQQIVRRVRGTRAAGYTDGLIEIDRRHAEAVVRTAVQHVAATAQDRMIEANLDLIKAVQWHAKLDTRTSEKCRVRDGLLYTPDTHKPIGHKVPWLSGPGRSHWNCRSLAVQMLKSFEEVTGIAGVGEIPVGARASMDGALPADLSYSQWLQKQSAARQDEVVGPTRGALMREGKLPFDELYSRRGEMLTLDQLRERNGAAFKRAGV